MPFFCFFAKPGQIDPFCAQNAHTFGAKRTNTILHNNRGDRWRIRSGAAEIRNWAYTLAGIDDLQAAQAAYGIRAGIFTVDVYI